MKNIILAIKLSSTECKVVFTKSTCPYFCKLLKLFINTPPLALRHLIGFLILLFAPAFLFSSTNTVQCKIGNTILTVQGTRCPALNTGGVRFYSQESARECTPNIRSEEQQKGLIFHVPNQGTGYCEVNLGAKKDPQAYQTFLAEIYSAEEVRNADTPKEFQDLFLKLKDRFEGGQISEEKWNTISTKLTQFEQECLQHAKRGPGFSCHARDFSSIPKIADLFQGRSSDGAIKLTMKFTHGKVGAFNTSEGADIDGNKITKEHVILDYSKDLDLEGFIHTDRTPSPGSNRGRATFDTHSAKNINLKNSKLTGVTFAVKNLEGINLENATLKTYVSPITKTYKLVKIGQYREDDGRGEFEYHRMTVRGKANLKNVTAHNMMVEEVDFIGEVDFEEGKAEGIIMKNVAFEYNDKKVSFKKAKMAGADLRNLNKNQELAYSSSKGRNPGKFDFTEADLTGADLRGSQFYDKAIFKKATLVSAKLQGAKLEGADFTEANLRFAKLQGANLKGANFTKANLRYTDVQGANFRNANFNGADIRGMKNLDNKNVNLTGADFTNALCWPEQYLMLKNKGAGECSIEERCRYLGSPTLIQTKSDPYGCKDTDKEGNNKGYCYAVVRCAGKDIPPVSFRAFCSTQNGVCPDPELCADENKPEEYKVFISKEEELLNADKPAEAENKQSDGSSATR